MKTIKTSIRINNIITIITERLNSTEESAENSYTYKTALSRLYSIYNTTERIERNIEIYCIIKNKTNIILWEFDAGQDLTLLDEFYSDIKFQNDIQFIKKHHLLISDIEKELFK